MHALTVVRACEHFARCALQPARFEPDRAEAGAAPRMRGPAAGAAAVALLAASPQPAWRWAGEQLLRTLSERPAAQPAEPVARPSRTAYEAEAREAGSSLDAERCSCESFDGPSDFQHGVAYGIAIGLGLCPLLDVIRILRARWARWLRHLEVALLVPRARTAPLA